MAGRGRGCVCHMRREGVLSLPLLAPPAPSPLFAPREGVKHAQGDAVRVWVCLGGCVGEIPRRRGAGGVVVVVRVG